MNKEIEKDILKFRDERDWKKFHNGKDLVISLVLEANELLEIYQWSNKDLECLDKLDKIKEELADILIYSELIADHYKLNIDHIVKDKIELNSKKYPVDKAYGKSDKYNKL